MIVGIKLRQAARAPVMRKIVWFFESFYFPAAYALCALLSSLLGLEVAFYTLTLLSVIYICLFCADIKPIIAVLMLVVYSTSWKHTPQPPYSSNFLNAQWLHILMLVYGAFVVGAFVLRLVVYNNGRNIFKESKLRLGIVLMTLAFILNGVAYGGYDIKNLPFGLLMALSFFFFYAFFFVTMNKDGKTGVYVAYCMFLAAGVVLLQLFKIYAFDGIFKEDGSVNKDLIIAGWGMSNNIGASLAMFMPAGFYLAIKLRHGWIYYALAFVVFGGVCLTQSRTSALVAGIILLIAAIILSVKKTSVRKFVRIFNCCVIVAAILGAIIFRDKVRDIFATFFERGFSDSGRFEIWLAGIKNFMRAPLFGVGFYEPIKPDWSYEIENWVFPDMYHNIFIQMLASCGIVGIIAYCIHLVQVVISVRKKPTPESLLYISVILSIFGMALFDNHIFHVFTALTYSLFLFLSEREGEDEPLFTMTPLLVKLRRGKAQSEPQPATDAANTSADSAVSDCANSQKQ